MELRVRVGRLVVVRDDRFEVARRLVVGDDVELTAPEVGKENGVVLGRRNRRERLGVELFAEHRLEGKIGAFEGRRRDGRARQTVGVDVRGEEDLVRIA